MTIQERITRLFGDNIKLIKTGNSLLHVQTRNQCGDDTYTYFPVAGGRITATRSVNARAESFDKAIARYAEMPTRVSITDDTEAGKVTIEQEWGTTTAETLTINRERFLKALDAAEIGA